MPAIAEVQFKAQGSQQVVTAFNSVGTAAQTSSTKVQQNSTAMKSMGQGMKTSVSSIGQVTTAFATLTLSIVNTWRSYRDLEDAQIAIDAQTKKLHTTQLGIKNLEADIAKERTKGKKGTLEYAKGTTAITVAEQKLKADRKAGKKTAAELHLEELKIQEMRNALGKTTPELAAKEEKLKVMREGLDVTTKRLGEAQEAYNDGVQNFYLSIIPTALSSIGLLTTAFKGLAGSLTGGGGIGGALKFFGPIGLAITGLYLAFKTNFLGIKDIVTNVIAWVKERFGAWQKTISEVFGLITKGDWAGAFNKIKEAAAKFWEDLKKSVPLFGGVADIVEKIQHGNWKGAFLAIQVALVKVWENIKKQVPILGDIEQIITDISEGKWGDAFQKIADTAVNIFNQTLGKGIEFLFGKNWISGLDAFLKLQESEAGLKKRPLILQYAITINGIIEDITGIDVMKWFTDHPLVLTAIPITLTGITMSITDADFQAALKKGAEVILGALGVALSAAAKVLDPYLAAVVKALNFNTAIISVKDALITAGKGIWTGIFNGIKSGFQVQDWGKLFEGFPAAVNDAWAKNLPATQQAIIQSFQGSPMNKALEAAGIKFNFTATPVMDPKTPEIIQKGVPTNTRVPFQADNTKMQKKLTTDLNKVMRGHYPIPFDANMSEADKKWKAFVKKVQMTTLQVKIAGGSSNIKTGSQAGAYGGPAHQHGYQSTVHRPTMFLAGEGGRPEDVTVRPRGSVQRGGGGGGGFYGTVNVYVDGVLRPARYDMGARK